jgi:transcription antitermination factor NusG
MGTGGDQRDVTTWVVLELTRQGELRIEEGSLAKHLRDALDVSQDHPIFIPSAMYTAGGRKVSVHLMEGYAFVGSGLPESSYLSLERGPYVRRVLTTRGPHGMRVLSVIPQSKVQLLRDQLREQVVSDVSEGMQVRITDGPYAHLDANVIELDGEFAHLHVTLRSLDLIARVPRMFIVPSDGEVP